MGLMSVEKFLCYFSLKVGGYVCGATTAITSAIGFIICLVIMIAQGSNHPGWWVILIINTVYSGLYLLASLLLLYGTRYSNPDRMSLYLIFTVLGIVVALFQILFFGLPAVAGAIIWALAFLYIFVCIYSLFKSVGGTNIFRVI